jgi:hypothetical protein
VGSHLELSSSLESLSQPFLNGQLGDEEKFAVGSPEEWLTIVASAITIAGLPANGINVRVIDAVPVLFFFL